MKNLISKLIPSVFLLSLPFLPSTAKAQDMQEIDSDSTYCKSYEFSYQDEIYRDIEIFSKRDSSSINFIFEKHESGIDTIFDEQKIDKEMEEIEKITNYEEKQQRADQLINKASNASSLRSKIREFFLIRNLFEQGYKTTEGNWNIFEKHDELKGQIERSINYLAYRGLEDVENPIPKPDFLRGLQNLTEQLQDLPHALENLGKSWQDLTGDEPLSQYERNQLMNESAAMARKYLSSNGELTPEGRDYFEKQIQYKIFSALERTREEENYYLKRAIFMEELKVFPRIATHPLAIFLAGEFGFYKSQNNFLEFYKNIRKDEEDMYKRSDEIDFKCEDYEYLLKNWLDAYEDYDAMINLLSSVRYNNDWKPKSSLTKDFVKAVYDEKDEDIYGSIAFNVGREYAKTEEGKLYSEQSGELYVKAYFLRQYIEKNVKAYEELLMKGYLEWRESLK